MLSFFKSSRSLLLFGSVCWLALFLTGCEKTAPTPTPNSASSIAPAEAGSQTPEKKSAPITKTASKQNEADKKTATTKASEVASTKGDTLSQDPPVLLFPEDINNGWIALFDGQSLFGWKANSAANWQVNEGLISVTPAAGDEPGLLVTTTPFADYELYLEFFLEQGGNSGIFLRTEFAPKGPDSGCYEFNICDSHETYPTGSIVTRQKPLATEAGEGEWKTCHIKVVGNQITAAINGVDVLDYKDESDSAIASGFIGLQSNAGHAEFRNIKLKPVGLNPIFNGQDLTGWRTVPGSKGTFEVRDEAIHVKGGAGFLETEQTWDNFVLQMDVHTNVENVNGGLFFRAEPGTEEAPSNGYELQVHNGYAEGDRRRPNDYETGFGSGAIFRRQKARWVVANDIEWYSMTLFANGPHFSTWVNGVQVTDFTDTRPADSNPRKGLRLDAGHLSLQGHDETTDVDFRDLQISELPN